MFDNKPVGVLDVFKIYYKNRHKVSSSKGLGVKKC